MFSKIQLTFPKLRNYYAIREGPGGSFSSLLTYQRCFVFYLCYERTHTPRTNISARSGRKATSARLITSIRRMRIAREKKNISNLPRVSTFDLQTYERKIFFRLLLVSLPWFSCKLQRCLTCAKHVKFNQILFHLLSPFIVDNRLASS